MGDNTERPGWVRASLHPTTTDEEADYIIDALREIRKNAKQWATEYDYDPHANEFVYKGSNGHLQKMVERWFSLV
jgi:hypothetical protein